MGRTNNEKISTQNSNWSERILSFAPVAASCYFFDLEDSLELKALPGFHYINKSVMSLESEIQDGQNKISCRKASYYLAYRIVTYTGVPLVANLTSLALSLALAILTLPTRCCNNELNLRSLVWLHGSCAFTLQSLWDVTADIRHLSRKCFTTSPLSLYSAI